MAMPDRASQNATAALVCGIVGLICCPITSIAAWVLGAKELAQINAGQSSPAGKTMAQIGMILGIIGVVLMVIYIVCYVIFGAAMFAVFQSGAVPQQ